MTKPDTQAPSPHVTAQPVAWWWEDKTGCVHITMDRTDAHQMAREFFCEARPLYAEPPAPTTSAKMTGRWLPIAQADKTITNVQDFPAAGLTLRHSDRYWVRDEDGRAYEASWSEGRNGRDYWWDWEGESPVDPVEFMPHPLDPRWIATTEGSDNG